MDSGMVVYLGWIVAKWYIPDGQWQGGISSMDSGKLGYFGWTVASWDIWDAENKVSLVGGMELSRSHFLLLLFLHQGKSADFITLIHNDGSVHGVPPRVLNLLLLLSFLLRLIYFFPLLSFHHYPPLFSPTLFLF